MNNYVRPPPYRGKFLPKKIINYAGLAAGLWGRHVWGRHSCRPFPTLLPANYKSPRKRFSRSALVTTDTDDIAIAPAAIIGLSNPNAASGIAAAL